MEFSRTRIRLHLSLYKGRQVAFVTICCEQRKRIFLDRSVGEWVVDSMVKAAARHCFALHAYCFMPDHLRVLVEGKEPACDLLRFLSLFKQVTAFEYRKEYGEKLWQGRYYDHVLRNADEIEKVAWYIWLNPVRLRLCAAPRVAAVRLPNDGLESKERAGRVLVAPVEGKDAALKGGATIRHYFSRSRAMIMRCTSLVPS